MRILVINPNTTASMTAKIGKAASVAAAHGTEIVAVNPKDGPPSPGDPKDGPGSPKGGPDPTKPLPESTLPQNGGTGDIERQAKLRKLEEGWGRMTERQRVEAMQQLDDLTRGLSPAHQEAYRNYFRNLANAPPRQ